jgi:hypothetical protein
MMEKFSEFLKCVTNEKYLIGFAWGFAVGVLLCYLGL